MGAGSIDKPKPADSPSQADTPSAGPARDEGTQDTGAEAPTGSNAGTDSVASGEVLGAHPADASAAAAVRDEGTPDTAAAVPTGSSAAPDSLSSGEALRANAADASAAAVRDEGTPVTDPEATTGQIAAADLPLGADPRIAPVAETTAAPSAVEGDALPAAAGDRAEPSWFDSAAQNREGEIGPAWQPFTAYGDSAEAVGDPGIVHAEHPALGGAGDKSGLAVDVFDGKSVVLQAWDTPSRELADKVLSAGTQLASDGRYEYEFDMFRTETSSGVGQFFSPTPPEADFDLYSARVGLPDSSRANPKPDVVVARVLTDAEGSKHFVTGHSVPQGLTDSAAANLEISHDSRTEAPQFNVGPDSFRAPGGDLNIVPEKGWFVVKERLSWDEYVARRDELIARSEAVGGAEVPDPRPVDTVQALAGGGSEGDLAAGQGGADGAPADWGPATDLPTNATIDAGDFRFGTDERGRIVQATGTLQKEKAPRERWDADRVRQLIPEGFDDQAGHLFAAALGGPGEHWNMVPQDRNLNQSEWKRMENAWKGALDRGPVQVDITPSYHGDDLRPYAFHVEYTVVNEQGSTETVQRDILNAPRAATDEPDSG